MYYTTDDAPYTIGCHRGVVDTSLGVAIPGPFTGRDQGLPVPSGLGEFGEVFNTQITNFYQADDGSYYLEYENGENTASTIYRQDPNAENCWEFEYRSDINQAGITETYCR